MAILRSNTRHQKDLDFSNRFMTAKEANVRNCRSTLANILALATILCLASPALAQRHSIIKPISGIVLDEQGKPIGGAKVTNTFSHCPVREAQTDSAGKFTIESSFGGNSDLLVAIAPDGETQGVLGLPHNLANWDGKEARIILKLAKPLRIKVIDGEGKPVADAKTGAIVRYSSHYSHKIWGTTNAEGIAAFKIPAGATSASFIALKSGVGFDYLNYGSAFKSAQAPEETSLMLDGAKALEFFAKDENGHPLSEAKVHFFVVSRPTPPVVRIDRDNPTRKAPPSRDDANLSYFGDELRMTPDADGKVRVDWWPAWANYMSAFGTLEGYTNARLDSKLNEEKPFNILRFHKLIKISGRVLSPTGDPVAGAEVVLGGQGNNGEGTNKSILSDESGRFEFGVPPHQLLMIGARSGKLVSPPINGLISKPGKVLEGLELKVRPGIRIHGTIAAGIFPAAGAQVMLKEIGKNLADFPGVSFPAPEISAFPPGFNPKIESQLIYYCDTDKRGKYEFYAPPGDYTVMLPLNPYGHETFKLTTEKEYEATFRSYVPIERIIENLSN
jgi:Carboxypeptidase regulatory-like domain